MNPEEQLAALQATIEEYERVMEQVDSDGDPTLAAMQAQKQLPVLYKQLLDWTKVVQAKPPAPVMREGPDNNAYQYDPTSGQWSRAAGIPDYAPQPPQPAQRAPRYADEEQLAQLNVQKAQRDLMNQYTLAQQQAEEAIQNIQEQLAKGSIDINKANRQIGLVMANTDAAMKGTTPWQMEQQKQTTARNVMSDRMQTGNSMAQGLLSGMLGAYGRLRTSNNPPPMPDPLAMARGFADDLGGGPEMGALAKAILMGAMGGQNNGMA